jgi:hypothetical protein
MSDSEQLQLRVIEYLYGEMTAAERESFEREAEHDNALGHLLEQESRLNSALPIGLQPHIEDERLQGNRWAIRQRFQRESRRRFSLVNALGELRQRPFAVAFQGVAMAMTFALGVMVASAPQSDLQPGSVMLSDNLPFRQVATPFQFIGDNDYEIYSLRVNHYDTVSGEIDLSFSLASEARVTGNVADQSINRLMAVALQDDIDSADRLDTIDALRPVAQGDEIYQALIHVLRNDENPGVRYQAVQALVTLRHEESVQEALRYALAEDVNEGVRVEAFNALAEYRDPQTLSVFRQQMENDSNEYIRAGARSIIEALESADGTTVY